jgi:broad specificity polyphosphatase/5'/3'-nucleotidase SurE
VVVHEDIGVGHYARHLQIVRQLAKEPLAVVVAPEDLRSAVAAACDMIDGVRKIDGLSAARNLWKVEAIPTATTKALRWIGVGRMLC